MRKRELNCSQAGGKQNACHHIGFVLAQATNGMGDSMDSKAMTRSKLFGALGQCDKLKAEAQASSNAELADGLFELGGKLQDIIFGMVARAKQWG